MHVIETLEKLKVREGRPNANVRLEKAYTRKIIDSLEKSYCKGVKLDSLRCTYVEPNDLLVASLTSFPERLNYVHLAIMSILNQTVVPSRIILWLSKEQCMGIDLPKTLTDLCEYGLEIRYCDDDLLGHKKYYYAMQEFKDKCIITFDDDLIYPEKTIERLLNLHNQYPDCIVCTRGKLITSNYGGVLPYKQWKISNKVDSLKPLYSLMASTGAGTLYPPMIMPKETFNVDLIKSIALTADDLWIKVLSANSGIKTIMVERDSKYLCIINTNQKVRLADANINNHKNESILKNLFDLYPRAMDLILSDSYKMY